MKNTSNPENRYSDFFKILTSNEKSKKKKLAEILKETDFPLLDFFTAFIESRWMIVQKTILSFDTEIYSPSNGSYFWINCKNCSASYFSTEMQKHCIDFMNNCFTISGLFSFDIRFSMFSGYKYSDSSFALSDLVNQIGIINEDVSIQLVVPNYIKITK